MQTPFIHSYYMKEKKIKKRLISFMAVVFLLIIVLQYGEDKTQRGKLSVSFSNHGPFIKQLNCNFIIREEKTKCCKIPLLLVSLILKLFHFSNLINVKMP